MTQKIDSLDMKTYLGKKFKMKILNVIKKRFDRVKEVCVLSTAVLLYLRFKKLHFKKPMSVANGIDKIKKQLDSLNESYNKEEINNICVSKSTQFSTSTGKESNFWDFYDNLLIGIKNQRSCDTNTVC